MGSLGAATARAVRWAAIGACSLSLALPCIATPLSPDTGNRGDMAAAASRLTDDGAGKIESATDWEPLDALAPANAEPLAAGGEDSLSAPFVEPFEVPLDLLAPRAHGGLGFSWGHPATATAAAGAQAAAPVASPDDSWRHQAFTIVRWTTSVLAVLVLAGVALVLVVPGLLRRLLFPNAPPLPAHRP